MDKIKKLFTIVQVLYDWARCKGASQPTSVDGIVVCGNHRYSTVDDVVAACAAIGRLPNCLCTGFRGRGTPLLQRNAAFHLAATQLPADWANLSEAQLFAEGLVRRFNVSVRSIAVEDDPTNIHTSANFSTTLKTAAALFSPGSTLLIVQCPTQRKRALEACMVEWRRLGISASVYVPANEPALIELPLSMAIVECFRAVGLPSRQIDGEVEIFSKHHPIVVIPPDVETAYWAGRGLLEDCLHEPWVTDAIAPFFGSSSRASSV